MIRAMFSLISAHSNQAMRMTNREDAEGDIQSVSDEKDPYTPSIAPGTRLNGDLQRWRWRWLARGVHDHCRRNSKGQRRDVTSNQPSTSHPEMYMSTDRGSPGPSGANRIRCMPSR